MTSFEIIGATVTRMFHYCPEAPEGTEDILRLRAILLTFLPVRLSATLRCSQSNASVYWTIVQCTLVNVSWPYALWSNSALPSRVIQIAADGEIGTNFDALLKLRIREFSRPKVLL